MIGTDIARAVDQLRKGNIVGIPTETVYGLAANAYDADAVLKIFQAKNRPSFDPLIVHVHNEAQVQELVTHIPPEAHALMKAFWPGPLTLVLPKLPQVPDIVTSGLDTVGVRMPAHPLTLELLDMIDFPLAAPSANPFGYISPTTAQHVADQLGNVVPYILDGGPCMVGVESTILGWEDGHWILYRTGGITQEAIEAIIGMKITAAATPLSIGGGMGVRAPGMIESHYAPRKPLIVGDVDALLAAHAEKRAAVITFTRQVEAWRCEALSPSGDLNEAARHLFSTLRALDASEADVILAEVFPNEGLGRAINDRLKRAAAK